MDNNSEIEADTHRIEGIIKTSEQEGESSFHTMATQTTSIASASAPAPVLEAAPSSDKQRFPCTVEGCTAILSSKWSQASHVEAHARGSLRACFRCGTSWGHCRFCEECTAILVS